MKTRIAEYAIAFFVILLLNFCLPRLMPGDPLTAIYGEEALLNMSPDLKQDLVTQFGTDQPFWEQFARYLGRLAHGDLGYSYARKAPVTAVLLAHAPWTLLLVGTAFVAAWILGLFLGVESGWRRGRVTDRSLLTSMMALSGFPSFFVGVVFLLIFAVNLQLFPLQGAQTAYADLSGMALLGDIVKHLCLPLLTLVLVFLPGSYLLSRNSMVSTLKHSYVVTAKAKGVTERRVRWVHAARNALLPVVTASGMTFAGRVITGALFVEIVFSYPGMGSLVHNALVSRDYPLLQGCLLLVTVAVLAINLTIDLLYRKLDPRIRSYAR